MQSNRLTVSSFAIEKSARCVTAVNRFCACNGCFVTSASVDGRVRRAYMLLATKNSKCSCDASTRSRRVIHWRPVHKVLGPWFDRFLFDPSQPHVCERTHVWGSTMSMWQALVHHCRMMPYTMRYVAEVLENGVDTPAAARKRQPRRTQHRRRRPEPEAGRSATARTQNQRHSS